MSSAVKEIATRALQEIANSMPQEHHADPRTGYYGRSGAGAVIYSCAEDAYLLIQRSNSVTEPGTWGTVGGIQEPGETFEQTAKREIREEIGYDGEYLEFKEMLLYRDAAAGFQYQNYLAVVPRVEFVPKLNWENSGFRWCPPDRWPEPLHFGFKALLNSPSSYDLMIMTGAKYGG